MARRHLRLSAVLAVVLLALTGFRPHGHGSHGDGDGSGGCSANTSGSGYHHSHYDDDDDDYDDYSDGGSSGSDASPTPTASQAPSGTIMSCADADDTEPAALVELVVADPHTDVTVEVEFLGADHTAVDTAEVEVNPYRDDLDADSTTDSPEVEIPMAHPDRADKVVDCRLVDVS